MATAVAQERSSITRGISLPSSLNRALEAQACREERSVSSLIRWAVRRYLAEQGAAGALPPQPGGGEHDQRG